ncbi:MAG: hypothetical protein VST70_00820 [Nitrospirota bacterium]|nr:hypothetical protein [Nitrospirota bacterium]
MTYSPIRTSGAAFLLSEDVDGGRGKSLFLRNNEGTNCSLVILGMESGVIPSSWPGS